MRLGAAPKGRIDRSSSVHASLAAMRAMMKDVLKDSTMSGSESGDGAFSAVSELRGLAKGRGFLACSQVVVSFLEGALEAAILTLFARLALQAVEADSTTVFVPGLGEQEPSTSLALLLALIGLRLSAGLSNIFLSNRLQFALVREIRSDALSAYSGSSWITQSQLDDGAVQQLVVTIPNGISSQLAGLINNFGHVAIMLSMLGYSMLTDARLTSLLVLVIVVSTFIFRPLRALIKRSAARALIFQKDLSSGVAQLVGIRFEVQTFGLADAASTSLRGAVESDAVQSERLGRLKGSVVPLFTTVTYLAVTLSIVILVNTNSGNLERTGPILLVVLRSLSYGTAIQQAASGLASLRPSMELLRSRIDELRDGQISWGSRELKRFESCRLERVTFAYPSTTEAALQESSFEIARGSRVGLVGPSGSGKSTITRLVLGLLQPHGGQILINGQPLHDYDRESWSRQVGVVPQSAQVIHGSIADNLRLYRDGITDEDLWEALEIADLRKEIAALPAGLETLVGPGHRALSGGQQQRLAIARAFAARPEFVVMDEPTSSIDALSEGVVSDAIDTLPSGVTVVIVSHRMRILRGCDMLVVVEDGRISALGTPEEVESKSAYVRSLDTQRAN